LIVAGSRRDSRVSGSFKRCEQVFFQLRTDVATAPYQPKNGSAIADLVLALTDLEDFSRLDIEFFNLFSDGWIDVHRAIVGESVFNAIAVPAFDSHAISALQRDFHWQVGSESHHLAAADGYGSVSWCVHGYLLFSCCLFG